MDKTGLNQILKRIRDHVLNQFYFSESDLTVKTDLYEGSSGISLFLFELQLIHPSKKLKDMIGELNRITLLRIKRTAFLNGYYSGTIGSIQTILQISTNLGQNSVTALAEQVLDEQISRQHYDRCHDITSGNAGTLLALLHCLQYIRYPSAKIHKCIAGYCSELMTGLIISEKGCYWGLTPQQIQGLCGFAHGASGIGFALMAAAKTYNSSTLQKIADAALNYEDSKYDVNIKNWPDFRHGIFDIEKDLQEFTDQYVSGDISFFFNYGDTVAWCHGPAGIGLTRLYSFTCQQSDSTLNWIYIAIKRMNDYLSQGSTIRINDLKLCHNHGGIFLSMELINHHLKNLGIDVGDRNFVNEFTKNFQPAWEEELGLYMKENDSLGLLNGLCGIGYFLIKYFVSENFENILYPVLPQVNKVFKFDLNLPEIFHLLMDKYFHKTNIYRIESGIDEINLDMLSYIELSNKLTCLFKELSVFEYEKEINKLLFLPVSNCYLYLQEKLCYGYILNNEIGTQPELILYLNPVCTLCELSPTYVTSSSLDDKAKKKYIINFLTYKGLVSWEVSLIIYFILDSFRNGLSIRALLQHCFNAFDIPLSDSSFNSFIMIQLEEFIKISLLIPEKKNLSLNI